MIERYPVIDQLILDTLRFEHVANNTVSEVEQAYLFMAQGVKANRFRKVETNAIDDLPLVTYTRSAKGGHHSDRFRFGVFTEKFIDLEDLQDLMEDDEDAEDTAGGAIIDYQWFAIKVSSEYYFGTLDELNDVTVDEIRVAFPGLKDVPEDDFILGDHGFFYDPDEFIFKKSVKAYNALEGREND